MARRSKDPQARIEALEQQMEESPSSPAFFPLASLVWKKGDGPRAEKLLRSGLRVLAMDRPQEAAEDLAAAVAKSPWNLQGQRLLAECRRRAGDEGGARRALRVAAMFDPSDPEARALLAEAPRPAAAPAAKRAPLPASGAEVPAVVPTPSLAQLYTSQGHHAQAAEVYRQLLQREPGNAEWQKQLGLLEARLAGAKKTAPPAPPSAGGDFDVDFEEEIAAPAGGGEGGGGKSGPSGVMAASALDDSDLDALLSQADQAEASLPTLDEEDEEQSILGSAKEAGVPRGAAASPPARDAALEDDLESFLGMEDETPGAALAAQVASGSTPEAALDEDLEELFAEAGGVSVPAAPVAPGAAAPDAALDEDLESLFAEGAGEGGFLPPRAAPPAAAARAEASAEETDLDALFSGEAEGVSAPAAPVAPGAAAPDAALDEELAGLFAEEGEKGESVPSLPQEAVAGAVASTEELDLEALFEEATDAPAEAAPAAPGASAPGAVSDAALDEELESLFAGEEEGEGAPAAAAPAAVEPAGTGEKPSLDDVDLEAELEEEDLGFLSEGAEPSGADEVEGLVVSAEGGAAPSGAAPEAPSSKGGPTPPAEEVEVAPVLRNLIGLYVEEGNLAQAIDLCRKASAMGAPSGWLASRMQEIESQIASGAVARLQESAKGDKEGKARSLSPADVVEHLEGWLQTLQRRKAKTSANH
ncbi:MAG: tetratricopeptide repeat protein [Candidatus Tectomicrobia bacterium]|nr:tetratricopeptide repeat protein [Candidatus Tectomicrobia bacterium]